MKTLEQHKSFPVVAWVLVVFFALFTVHITLKLKQTGESLSTHSIIEANIPPELRDHPDFNI